MALFHELERQFARFIDEANAEASRGVLSFPGSRTNELGTALFANLESGGFCTHVVTGRRAWDPMSPYFQACRDAALAGRQIERAFLLPHRHLVRDSLLQTHAELDRAAGIRVRQYFIGDLISTLKVPLSTSLDFGLWDDVVAFQSIYDVAGVSEWRASRRPEDITLLREIRDRLTLEAIDLEEPVVEDPLDLEEPMIVTAPLAKELAGVLCRGNHVSADDCSWYHSIWQYLRIFDMVSTPTWHADFYLGTMRDLIRSGEVSRILISGTADYSMLAHVLCAGEAAEEKIHVAVLDLCETPLFLSRWYAKRIGHTVEIIADDILKHRTSIPYDLIVTDAFLTRFLPNERPSVITAWQKLLRPGGSAVTTTRIEPGMSGIEIRATDTQIAAFSRRALLEAKRWQGFLGDSPEVIADGAEEYAKKMISYSFASREEVVDLFANGGFELASAELREVPGEMASTTYVDVVARRA